MKIVMTLLMAILLVGCTDNQRSRSFGGTSEVRLEKGRKLINVTWKNDDLWILTREKKEGETPETFKFSEDSSLGVLNGAVLIIEQ